MEKLKIIILGLSITSSWAMGMLQLIEGLSASLHGEATISLFLEKGCTLVCSQPR